MTLSFDLMTLAAQPSLQCQSKQCEWVDVGDTPAAAKMPQFTDKLKRNTDFAVNVLYLLWNICSGTGKAEAGRLLGMLGLPNATTMEAR